jgi:hypothetical protein
MRLNDMGETKIKTLRPPKICGAVDFKLLSATQPIQKAAPVEDVLCQGEVIRLNDEYLFPKGASYWNY